jgi:drug/metabolite transporter (DMT)-like permease
VCCLLWIKDLLIGVFLVIDLTLSSGVYKIASCVFFALINVLLKSIHLPAAQVTCFESLFAAILLWLFSVKTHPLPVPLSQHSLAPLAPDHWKNPLYWLRAALTLLSSWLWVVSMQRLPLLQTVSMGFLSPFVTILGARIFLKERLTLWRILAVLLAFLGGTLISLGNSVQGLSLDPWVLAPLLTTVLFAAINLISKSLLSHTPPVVLTRSLMMMTGLGWLGIEWFRGYDQWMAPSFNQWLQFAALGFLAAGAHMCSHMALARADVIALLPLGVIRLVLSGGLGWFFLQETPSFSVICGIICVIAASSCLSWRLKK